MTKGPRYNVPYRRRREGKTDYQERKALVLSKSPRLVTRTSLKHTLAQIVKAEVAGDKTIASAHSRELMKMYGWKGGCGNVPVAYLTGFLCGYRTIAKNVKEVVLDIGLHCPSKGARVFAVLKGVIDAGVKVPHSEEKLPDKTRIEGQHIVHYAKQLSLNPEEHEHRFSSFVNKELPLENLSEHFSYVKKKIVTSFEKSKRVKKKNHGG
ncbi:MAG: 50S ribosomal protein L18 [Thermoproteota archaeon]|nr:50S ribosomal protein L18 [Thermoproteota archaeon]